MKLEFKDITIDLEGQEQGGSSDRKRKVDSIYARTAKKFARPEVKKSLTVGAVLSIIALLLVGYFAFLQTKDAIIPTKAYAQSYQFTPTSANLVTGAETTFTSATAASAEGTNIGWRGMKSDDNLHWVANTSGTSFDAQVNFDGAQLNGANKMIIQTAIDVDAAMNLQVQICDYVSSTSVDAAADGTYCTGGGWRTLNTKNNSQAAVALFTAASTNDVAFQWHIYDGYWSTGTTGGTAISTPLTNFVEPTNKRVKLRYYTAAGTASSPVAMDYARIEALVDSVYHPAGFTQISGGTVASTQYGSAKIVGNAAAAQQATTTADATYLTVPGTAGVVASYYYSFKNVKTLPDMNAIYMKADYSCAATGVNIRPQIYNFTTTSWNDLTTANIACATADATNAWAKNNITMSDYVQNGEIRAGFRQLTASATASPRNDFIYIMVGSVNSDTADCEVTFGTGTATNCSNTRDLDGNGTTNVFANPAADESTTFATSFNAFDNDQDAVVEEATSSNVSMPVTMANNMAVVGVNYAARYAGGTPGATAMTVQPGLRDYSGLNQVTGGWTQFGSTSANATYVYTDTITAMANTAYGLQANPEDYIDTVNNQANIRLKTTASGTSTTNTTTNWDFAFVAPQWIEQPTVTVSPVGSQTTNMSIPSTNQYVGGAFKLLRSEGPSVISGIKIAESGTVNAQTNLDNIKLYYENDTSAPYDCGSEGFAGTENQYGSTDTDGFSAANGDAVFSGSATVGTNSALCLYTVVDVGSGAGNNETLDIRISNPSTDVSIGDGGVATTSTVEISGSTTLQSSGNQSPNSPTSLTQGTTSGANNISESSWTTDSTANLGFVVSDPDSADMVKYQIQIANNSSFTTPIIDYSLATPVTNGTVFSFLPGTYTGGTCTGSCPATLADSSSGYWWRVKGIDNSGASSGWSEPGVLGTMDFKVDATAPTGGTVLDGTAGDQDWNNGSLSDISANWSGVADVTSGLNKYEYQVQRLSDNYYWNSGWQAGTNWINNNLNTTFTINSIYLETGVNYLVWVRATDNVGNVSTPIVSNGQQVLPTLSFSLSSNSVNFSTLNSSNNWTDSQSVNITTRTNAKSGYVVQAYLTQLIYSIVNPTITIPNYAGTWAIPTTWSGGQYGFGYSSNDSSVQGSNRFSSATKFAGYNLSVPGDIVADNVGPVNGQTGAILNEVFTITNKISTSQNQAASNYRGIINFMVSANY